MGADRKEADQKTKQKSDGWKMEIIVQTSTEPRSYQLIPNDGDKSLDVAHHAKGFSLYILSSYTVYADVWHDGHRFYFVFFLMTAQLYIGPWREEPLARADRTEISIARKRFILIFRWGIIRNTVQFPIRPTYYGRRRKKSSICLSTRRRIFIAGHILLGCWE